MPRAASAEFGDITDKMINMNKLVYVTQLGARAYKSFSKAKIFNIYYS